MNYIKTYNVPVAGTYFLDANFCVWHGGCKVSNAFPSILSAETFIGESIQHELTVAEERCNRTLKLIGKVESMPLSAFDSEAVKAAQV